ncbi:MAG: TonB family protein [Hyphomicrobium sp.]|uniref:energy transducer TonB n=1 Tax=Hyphomicrobium sp. TaxID=82 RepID=UPI003D0B7C86
MIYAEAQLETPAGRFARWSGSAGVVAVLHVTAVMVALLAWPQDPPSDERPGALMIELESLAAESPSDQQNIAEQPLFEKSVPPPSPTDQIQETPPEPSEAAEAEPVPEKAVEAAEAPPAVEPVAEPVPEELPNVEEAPLAPEPEVTLPKEVEKAEKTPEPKEKAEQKPEKKVKEKAVAKSAQKSESKKQQQAAASAKGKFDPNPIYRANPVYPPSARAAKVEGYVVVRYSVSASGAVTSVSVVSAKPSGVFNAATVAAVRQWRFKPSAQGGTRSTTVRFKLK